MTRVMGWLEEVLALRFDQALSFLLVFLVLLLFVVYPFFSPVGYGDVTPLTQVAKQLAVLEGLFGQLYPAILLARLVSLQVTNRQE